ncbi:hypothetical protein G7Z17_g13619 [Cylindrodendrum hubeiense]|uniref:Uncharacterized protein n=1 Tax=Cylindrodendrum hubeiense TaxID=595255 RepID=A0A9P5H0N8_9HYPO|nr:hypothetical protein G7Z17_g13619 [Cylindrodendrum hubeiense]
MNYLFGPSPCPDVYVDTHSFSADNTDYRSNPFAGMTLDEFMASLQVDTLRDALRRRQIMLASLFKDASTKVKDPYSASSDQVSVDLREKMKDLLNKQQSYVQDIRHSKEHLRVFANVDYDEKEATTVTLKMHLVHLVKEAWKRDEQLVEAISEYESLDDMEENKEKGRFGLPNYPDSFFMDDAVVIHWPAEAPPFDDTNGYIPYGAVYSRRVLLSNLPKGITPAQILKGVRGLGGLLQIYKINAGKITGDGTDMAMLEFHWPSTALEYTLYLMKKPMYYMDAKGVKYRAGVEHVPTRSWPVSSNEQHHGCVKSEDFPTGRSLRFTHFPQGGVWYFIDQIGTKNIIEVSYMKADDLYKDGTLTVEFTTVFEAGRVRTLVEEFEFKFYKLTHPRKIIAFYSDAECRTDSLWKTTNKHIIPHVPVDHLALKWDVRPWNMLWPTSFVNFPAPSIPRKPVPASTKPETALLKSLNINIHSVEQDEGKTCYAWGHRYAIVGTTIRIYSRDKRWTIAQKNDVDSLFASTSNIPEYSKFWDTYFANNDMINVRKWEEYAKIARHRREKSAEQGLQD